jgi:hypothetical protein
VVEITFMLVSIIRRTRNAQAGIIKEETHH